MTLPDSCIANSNTSTMVPPQIDLIERAQVVRDPTFDECRAIVDVLSRLPPRQRAVLELRMKCKNPAQIAAELGLTREVAIRELGRALYVATKELPHLGDRT